MIYIKFRSAFIEFNSLELCELHVKKLNGLRVYNEKLVAFTEIKDKRNPVIHERKSNGRHIFYFEKVDGESGFLHTH